LATLHRVLDLDGEAIRARPAAASALEALLATPDGLSVNERAAVVEAYARLTDIGPGSTAAAVLTRCLADPAEAVRLAASARLQCAGSLARGDNDLDTLLIGALASDDGATRHVAMDELRAVLLGVFPPNDGTGAAARWSARLALLTPHLNDPRDRARAAEIHADLAERHGQALAEQAGALVAYVADPDPRVRGAVLRFIGALRLSSHIGWLVERLASEHEDESRAAAAALRAFGPAATNTLLDTLHRGKRAARQAVLPILRDLHLDSTTLRALIEREIEGLQRTRLLSYGLRRGHVSEIVLQRLSERVDEGAQIILLLLATLRNEARFAVVGRLLVRSPHGRGRAVLLEALEALLPLDERLQLIPLLDDQADPHAAARALDRPLPSFEDAVREALADSDAITASLLRATLGAGLAAPGDLRNTTSLRDDAEPGMLSTVEIMLHLRSLDLFARLTTRQLSELAAVVHEEDVGPGSTIVREGAFGDCMYLIVSGEVEITRAGEYTIGASAGDLFGEMALFDGETRFATVTAVRSARLLRLERHDLFELMEEQPAIAIGICQTLSRHMRDSLKRLEERRGETKASS
jgi:CRP-like cAMP-binding protein